LDALARVRARHGLACFDAFNLDSMMGVQLIHRSTSGPLPTSRFDLVDDEGHVLGFCQVRHRPSHSKDLPPEAANHIYYEITEPYRGRGYGKVLMGLALAEAKRIGLDKVRLMVVDDNPVSRHIIEAHGAIWLRDFVCKQGERYHLYEVELR
jgi:predicted acetyltransferase